MSENITIKIELEIERQKVSSSFDYNQYLEIKKFHPSLDPIEMMINQLKAEIERGI
jgi:hypothetical protein